MEKQTTKVLDSYLAKYAAMMSILTCTTPLEILKMRMISSTELHSLGKIAQPYSSIRNCLKTVLRDEGARAFWNGNVIMLARVLPIESINYETRRYLQQRLPNTLSSNILIAIVSGITAITLVYPSDIIRQIMNNNTKSHISILATIKEIHKQKGYTYFFKGYPNVLLTLTIYRGAYNGTYDTHKHQAKNLKEKARIAYLCTIFAEYLTYPVEIVRRRRIAINAQEGFLPYASRIWAE
jgi:hypothetical protein